MLTPLLSTAQLSKTQADLGGSKKDMEAVRSSFTAKMQKLHDKESKAKSSLKEEERAHQVTSLTLKLYPPS
jgi:hypothetical protein